MLVQGWTAQPDPKRQQCDALGTRAGTRLILLWLLIGLQVGFSAGCSTQKFLIRRDTPANPLAVQLNLASSKGPTDSQRTEAVLRRFALRELYLEDPLLCLEAMQTLLENEVENGLVYSISELAYILGKRAEVKGNEGHALDMYGVAVSNAYMYLFSPE